jgi:hypothetical protein
MRRGTLIALIVLFIVLAGAAVYQLTLGQSGDEPLCGPKSPGAVPTRGACPTAPVPSS